MVDEQPNPILRLIEDIKRERGEDTIVLASIGEGYRALGNDAVTVLAVAGGQLSAQKGGLVEWMPGPYYSIESVGKMLSERGHSVAIIREHSHYVPD